MKKICFIFVLLFTLLLTGCSSNYLEKIDASELNQKLNNKETFILYFGSGEKSLENILIDVLKEYELKGYKIDIDKLSDEEINTLKLKFDYKDPSIIFIIEGNDPTVLSHIKDDSATSKTIKETLKNMNFIQEEK